MKLINRLLIPSDGEVYVESIPTTQWDLIRLSRRIGYVIQETGLFPHFTVERNIGLVPKLEGWEPQRIEQRVQELLRLVRVGPAFGPRLPSQLSGGQRERVGVARALAADPSILLMDEPFGALYPITRAELQREFLGLQNHLLKAVVFVTHDVHEALLLATIIGFFDARRLVERYTPEEFRRAPNSLVRQYLAAIEP